MNGFKLFSIRHLRRGNFLIGSKNEFFSARYTWNERTFVASTTNTLFCQVRVKESGKKKPIWYYDNFGIRKRKIDQMFRFTSQPDAVSSDVQHARGLIKVFMKYGLEKEDLKRLLYHKPRLFQLSKDRIEKRILTLDQLGIPEDTVKTMILKCPSLLLLDETEGSIQKRLNNLQELPLFPRLNQQRCIYLIQKCPNLLMESEKSALLKKVKMLLDFGYNNQQLFELVMKQPAILTYSEKAISDKVEYVVDKMGGNLSLFIKFPRVLTSSLKRIKERHLYLLDEGYMKSTTYISENKLRAIVLPTDNDFVYRVTNTKMKDFRDFQEKVLQGEITYETIMQKVNGEIYDDSDDVSIDDDDDDDDDIDNNNDRRNRTDLKTVDTSHSSL